MVELWEFSSELIGSTSNWSHARPGTFISATSLRQRSGLNASTRQKSKASPTAKISALRRPRRIPTPPTKRSRNPLNLHRNSAKYQPFAPPICRIGVKAAAGVADTRSVRESTSRVPKRTPPHERILPADESASDQDVSANSWFSLCKALSIAALKPLGLILKALSAEGFCTSV